MHRSIPAVLASLGLAGSLAAPSAALASGRTYTGAPAKMKWGTVTVTLTASGRHMTNISATYPADRPRSKYINRAAVSILRRQALRSQSYRLHNLSGATLTVRAFESSLASAMHKAHI